ncbi:MAG TPA: hypothetical protein VJ907_01100 [Halanaerobiales bacterium]|nr:hypothetical protein [Halanaerobiales bacterium]
MNIGIDIDGVITHEKKGKENIWLRALNNYFEDKITRKKDVYNFTEAYDIPLEDLKEFLNNKLHEIYSSVEIAPGAKNMIDKIKSKGHTIYLITARHSEFRPLTIKWLEQHQVNYDYLYHEDQKAKLAVKKNIELFIEDNEANTREIIKENIPVILVDKYHNKDIEDNELLFRIEDWDGIKEVLENYIFNN